MYTHTAHSPSSLRYSSFLENKRVADAGNDRVRLWFIMNVSRSEAVLSRLRAPKLSLPRLYIFFLQNDLEVFYII